MKVMMKQSTMARVLPWAMSKVEHEKENTAMNTKNFKTTFFPAL